MMLRSNSKEKVKPNYCQPNMYEVTSVLRLKDDVVSEYERIDVLIITPV